MVSFAPLLRFQGMFLCLAFIIAYSVKEIIYLKTNKNKLLVPLRIIVIGGIIIIPFTLWTIRNYLVHTPDTFNMANSLFWGLPGLKLYASEYGNVDWIQHEWMYGVYAMAYSIVNIHASIIGRKLVNYFPIILICVVSGFFVVAGAKKWIKNASLMEIVYVIFSLTFIVKKIVFSKNLYIVDRYWLPMLPFILLSFLLGINAVFKRLKPGVIQIASAAVLIVFAVLICFHGITFSFKLCKSRNYYSNAASVFPEIKEFMNKENVDKKNIAVTDWGVMPFILDQKCFQVLNDKNHLQTLKRMSLYETQYLVIFTGLAAFYESALEMVDELPQVFNLIYEKKFDKGPDILIFRVDIDNIKVFLNQ